MTDPTHRNPSPHLAANNAPSTWAVFGTHRLRAPIGIVIDAPFPIVGGWVAVIWPDASDPASWRRLVWQPDTEAGRGWLIPERLAYADIIEFGSDPTGAQRWYGIVDSYEPGAWLTVRGPYPSPVEANQAADALLDPGRHVAERRPSLEGRRQRDRCRSHPR